MAIFQYQTGNATNAISNASRVQTLVREIDLAKLYTANPTFVTTDSVEIWRLPQYTQLNSLQAYIATAVTNVTRLDVGDTGSDTRYVSNHATFTAGSVMTQALTVNPLRFYTSSTAAANAINLKITGTPASMTGIIVFVANVTDCKRVPPAFVN